MKGLALLCCLMLVIGEPAVFAKEAKAPKVPAACETDPVPSKGDAADDICIWIHPEDPSLSLVIGTDKEAGLAIYDLQGKQLHFLADGKLNNVDVRYRVPIGGDFVDLVAAGNRTDNTIRVYRVDAGRRTLVPVAARPINVDLEEAYGFTLYQSRKSNRLYAFVSDPTGKIEQWELFDDGLGRVDARRVRHFKVKSAVEGLVADDAAGVLFVAEEDKAIWKYPAEPDDESERVRVDRVGKKGHLEADVEGLAIYRAGGQAGEGTGDGAGGYLLASSQGSNEFVIYDLAPPHRHLVTFSIGKSDATDKVTDTDGIDVTSVPLGEAFPHGLFVAQDGKNKGGNQNFKFVRWELIAATADPPLAVASSSPR